MGAVANCDGVVAQVLVFASHHHGARLAEVVAGVRAAAGDARVVACSGYGTLTELREIEEAAAVAVLAIAGDALTVTPLVVPAGAEADRALGERLGAALSAGSRALVLLPGPDAGWPEDILAGLAGSVPVFGAGLSGPWEPPAVALDEAVTEGGTLAIALGGSVGVAYGHSFSLRPAGPLHQVTDARGDRILTLDGRPAREVLAEDVGAALLAAAEAGEASLFLGSPRDPAATALTPDGYAVSVVDLADASLIAPGGARVGATVGFVVRDSQGARADLDGLLSRLAAETASKPPAFGLYFNCAARGRDLHGTEDVDVSLIRARFPGLPLAGLFGSFELAPAGGQGQMHAYTGVLLLVGEA